MTDRSVLRADIEHTVSQRRDPFLASTLDGYRIDEKIAEGGFGAVYRATHLATGDVCAVKVLHPHFARDPNMTARFQREAAAMARLRNRHTVGTREVGEAHDGTLYIAMELLEGEMLHDRLRRVKTMSWVEAVRIGIAVCESLAEAHALGMVHRDLKPANIHLAKGTDFVKVIDFGIVAVRGSTVDDGEELTRAGMTVGTLDYMSPEQVMDRETDARSDLYALGVILYELVSGTRPYGALTGPQLLAAMLTTSAPPVSQHVEVPLAFERVIMKCLRREAKNRFDDVLTLAAQLEMLVPEQVPDEDEATTWCVAPTTSRGQRFDAEVKTAATVEAPRGEAHVRYDAVEKATIAAVPPPPHQYAAPQVYMHPTGYPQVMPIVPPARAARGSVAEMDQSPYYGWSPPVMPRPAQAVALPPPAVIQPPVEPKANKLAWGMAILAIVAVSAGAGALLHQYF